MVRLGTFILALTVSNAFASTWTVDHTHSNITFTVRHLVTKVSGSFNTFDGTLQFDDKKPESSKVNVQIQTDSIFTANSQRDDHLRSPDFLNTKRHPTAQFSSTKVASLGKGQFKIEGTLTLRGQTRPVSLDVEYLGTAKDLQGNTRGGFVAKTKLSRKDFGLSWNKLTEAGNVVVGDEIELLMNIAAVESRPQEAKKETGTSPN
jgi:polyisoprenoid-binding protein YceI